MELNSWKKTTYMEHLSLEIFDLQGTGSAFATMDDDASITVTDTSEVFAKGDLWSYSFKLNVRANARIFGSAGDMHGARLHEQVDRRRARLWADGTPMYTGYIRLASEADVDEDGDVDVTFEAGQKTFDDLIDGAKANQVPMMSDVLIGLALWRKRKTTATVRLKASIVFKYDGTMPLLLFSQPTDVFYQTDPHTGTLGLDVPFSADGEEENVSVQEYPRMVFPRLPEGSFEDLSPEGLTEIDCINTDHPYDDAHPYCNVALCYQRYGYQMKDAAGSVITDYGSEPEAQRGYEYAPADRLNSAPNFYVIYWIRALMKHLGIHIEENQMMDVEDLRRLFFVNTDCSYYEPKTLRSAGADTRFGKYRFRYEGRSIHRLVPEYFGYREAHDFHGTETYAYRRSQNVSAENSGFVATDFKVDPGHEIPEGWPEISRIDVKVDSVEDWDDQTRERYERDNGYLHRAFATSDCFPDADVSEVVKAIEAGFGIRFLFSSDYKRVRIVLLRNIFRSTDVQDVACDVVSRGKTENAIRGFRMTYGDSDDTQFRYKGFDDLLPKKDELWKDESDKHDYSHWKLDAVYSDIIRRISAFDKTCYVTPATGDAYGIKIDKDAKRYEELHPSLFEYAGYMDALDGDCTGEESTIETVSVGFKPAIMNDLNMEDERNGSAVQMFALFSDGEMRPRRPDLHGKDSPYSESGSDYPIYGTGGLYDEAEEAVARGMKGDDGIVKPGEFAIASDMFASMDGYQLHTDLNVTIGGWFDTVLPVTMNIDGHLSEGYRLYLQDNFTPNDDGVSPMETHDWGLTLGIMRGSGSDAYVRYDGDPDDGEGNDTWRRVAGKSVTSHPDTCDSYGAEWDYNGTGDGIGPDGRVSLKLRAEKPNPEFDPSKPEGSDNRRYLQVEKERLRGRGLIDQFYKEYSYWVRNARIARLEVRMELAQLLTIDKTKKVRIGDITGFIRKMQYTISNRTGLSMVKMEIMYI